MKKSSEVNKYVGIFKDAFNFLASASVYSIIKVLCFITITITLSLSAIMAYRAISSEEFITALAHRVNEEQDREESKNLDIRDDKVTPKIQKEIEMLCYTAMPVRMTSRYKGEGSFSCMRTGSMRELSFMASILMSVETSSQPPSIVGTITATSMSLQGLA